MTAFLFMLCAVALDWILGEPRRWHPLVGFGRLAAGMELRLYRPARFNGVLAWALAVLLWVGLAAWLQELPWVGPFIKSAYDPSGA